MKIKFKYDKDLFKKISKLGKKDQQTVFKKFGFIFADKAKREARKHTLGGRFWHSIAESITYDYINNGVSVGATHEAAGHKHTGGVISAPGKKAGSRGSRYLTIPISEKSKLKNANDFSKKKTFIKESKKGNLLIFLSNDDSTIEPLFVLKESVKQKPEPWFPYNQADQALRETLKYTGLFNR